MVTFNRMFLLVLMMPALGFCGWKEDLQKTRMEKDAYFKNDSQSPMAAEDRRYVEADQVMFLGLQDGQVRYSNVEKSGSLIVLFKEKDYWTWGDMGRNEVAHWNGKELKPGPIETGMDLQVGNRTIVLYPTPSYLVMIVFSPERVKEMHFSHLVYYEPNPDFRVQAQLKRYSSPAKVAMGTSQNQEKSFYKVAELRFEIKGTKHHLSAFKSQLSGEYSNILFIPFTDSTTGKATYSAGRFLEIEDPGGDSMVLDFNEAFNPLCNYSHAYNCPYPPDENQLPLAVLAGEKTYPMDH